MEKIFSKSIDELNVLVEKWHNDESIECSLQDYLGLDDLEYKKYLYGLEEVIYFKEGEKRRLVKIPDDREFMMMDGSKEVCPSTGYQAFFAGNWWYEYKDSKGGLHYYE